MKNVWIMVLLVTGLLASGCIGIDGAGMAVVGTEDGGSLITTEQPLEDVSAVRIEFVGDVQIDIGSPAQLVIEGKEKAVDLVETESIDGELIIAGDIDQVREIMDPKLTFQITLPELSAVTLDGVGKIVANGIAGDQLTIQSKGAGYIEASGSANLLTVELNGAGSFDGEQLLSETADIIINGAGNAVVHASETLNAEINGIGNVSYLGDPMINRSGAGIGTVQAKN